ncbi:MAG: hypothetical protein HY885_18295 [Deltaproteobacteria bacterium]|nr:hypothetical protein [Deltaproteobacteria bacterium]
MTQRSRSLSLGLALFLAAGIFSADARTEEGQAGSPPAPETAQQPLRTNRLDQESSNRHKDTKKLVDKSAHCLECHQDETPGIFEEWVNSTHARAGVGCADCHAGEKSDKSLSPHAGKFFIRTVVTPYICAKCHKEEALDFSASGHARALELLKEMKEDDPRYPVVSRHKDSDFSQCGGCHGVVVSLDENNLPNPATWPGSGAGRINPDKSHGTCASCHMGHRFSVATARQPETCLRCHDGANYPEGEIYRHSLHGVAYETQTDKKLMDRTGFFYDASQMGSPTCAFCHMNGSGHGLLTQHNPAWRLPHDLTSPQAPLVPRAENLRNNMKSGCNQCHASGVVDRFFADADSKLQEYQKNVVEPKLAEFKQKLSAVKEQDRRQLVDEYSRFLTESKGYRMNLYMGRHGRTQR